MIIFYTFVIILVYPENDANLQPLKISSTKKGKGRRGRGSKSSQLKDTFEEKETMADICVVPLIENNAEIEKENVTKFEGKFCILRICRNLLCLRPNLITFI